MNILKKNLFNRLCSNNKALSKAFLYILFFSFFIIYSTYFSQFTQLIFAATPTPSPPTLTDNPDPQKAGSAVTFQFTCSDGVNTVAGYVCKNSVCTNCDATSQTNCWCYSGAVASNPSCTYTCPTDVEATNTYYGRCRSSAGQYTTVTTAATFNCFKGIKWPHITLLSSPSSVVEGSSFSITLKYTHDMNDNGGINLNWANDIADFVSSTGGTIIYQNFLSGSEVVEWNVSNNDHVVVTLKAIKAGTLNLNYRVWDWTGDNVVCTITNSPTGYDFHRDPDTCEICWGDPGAVACSHKIQSIIVLTNTETTTTTSSTSSTTTTTTPPVVKGEIQIYKGWNLISFPNSDSIGLRGNCSSSILNYYFWDASSGKWTKYTSQTPVGKGFWVYSNIECKMEYTGSTQISAIGLSKGWNIIGSFTTIKNVADVNDGCTIVQAPLYYNSQTSSWETDVTVLTPTKGYWIQLDNVCSFSIS